ncbi:hypothetical protein Tco_1202515 [Tanacetum coccineum]
MDPHLRTRGATIYEEQGEKESKAKKPMIRKSKQLQKQRAIAYIGVYKLNKLQRQDQDANFINGRSSSSLHLLSKRKFVIVCHEKVVRIPLEGDEILRVHGERTQGVMNTLMNRKSCKMKVSYDLVIFRREYQCRLLRGGAWSSFEVSVGITEEGEVVTYLTIHPQNFSKIVQPLTFTIIRDQIVRSALQNEKRKERSKTYRVFENVLTEILHGFEATDGKEKGRPDELCTLWIILGSIGRKCNESLQKSVRDANDLSLLESSSGMTKSGSMIQTLEDYNERHVLFDFGIRLLVLPWAEIGESSLIGPKLVQETTDSVFLGNVVIRFGKNGKLAPSYVGLLEILERIGPVAYQLRLPEELSRVHDIFHVSNLRKCLADASLHVPLDEIRVDKTLRFVEEPIKIMDREVKSLKRSRILLVKGIDGLLVVSVIVSLQWIVDSERDRLIVVDRGTRSVPLFVMLSVTVSTWFGVSSLISLNRESCYVLVGIDRLSKRKFRIVCHEKVVRIPLEGDEILRVHGERTQGVVKTLMNTKVGESKLSGISIVQDFIDVFPEDLSMTTAMAKDEHGVHLKLVLELLRKEKLLPTYDSSSTFLRLLNPLLPYLRGIRSVKDKILATTSETFKVENAPAEMLRDLNQQMEKCADDGKANVVTDALSRKERVKPRRIRAMAMTIQYGVRGKILTAQSEAFNYQLSIRCVPFEALYGRKCTSPVLWAEIRESSLIGPELVQEMTDKVVLIKEKLIAARDCQKSYVDNRRKPLEFEGKLAPRYVGPLEILERIGPVAYRLRLPDELSGVHYIFHVSNLRKCLADASLHVPLDEIRVDKTLCFVEEPVEIMDREVKNLKRKRILLMKVH